MDQKFRVEDGAYLARAIRDMIRSNLSGTVYNQFGRNRVMTEEDIVVLLGELFSEDYIRKFAFRNKELSATIQTICFKPKSKSGQTRKLVFIRLMHKAKPEYDQFIRNTYPEDFDAMMVASEKEDDDVVKDDKK